jgi:hypothetical protein
LHSYDDDDDDDTRIKGKRFSLWCSTQKPTSIVSKCRGLYGKSFVHDGESLGYYCTRANNSRVGIIKYLVKNIYLCISNLEALLDI